MQSDSHLIQSLRVAMEDHKMINQCINNYNKLCTSATNRDWVAAFDAIDEILDCKIAAHFVMEEKSIFPEVAKVYPTAHIVSCIEELEKGHKKLLEEVRQINDFLERKPIAQGPNQDLIRRLGEFFVQFTHHATQENEFFNEINRLIYSIGTPPVS